MMSMNERRVERVNCVGCARPSGTATMTAHQMIYYIYHLVRIYMPRKIENINWPERTN